MLYEVCSSVFPKKSYLKNFMQIYTFFFKFKIHLQAQTDEQVYSNFFYIKIPMLTRTADEKHGNYVKLYFQFKPFNTRKHTLWRNHDVVTCNSMFSFLSLKIHYQIHTVQKTFSIEVCFFAFSRDSCVNTLIKTMIVLLNVFHVI